MRVGVAPVREGEVRPPVTLPRNVVECRSSNQQISAFGAAAESRRVHSLCAQIRSICTHARPAIWRLPRRGATGRGSAAAVGMAIPPTGVPGVDEVGVGEPDSVAR